MRAYFEDLGLYFGKYKNPADQLLKLANQPHSFDSSLTQESLLMKIYSTEVRTIDVNPDSWDKEEWNQNVFSLNDSVLASQHQLACYSFRRANFFQ